MKRKLLWVICFSSFVSLTGCGEGGNSSKSAEASAYLASQQGAPSLPQLADLENQFPNVGVLFVLRPASLRGQTIQMPYLDTYYLSLMFPQPQGVGQGLFLAYIQRAQALLDYNAIPDEIQRAQTDAKLNQIRILQQQHY